jgi:hypothetical protein
MHHRRRRSVDIVEGRYASLREKERMHHARKVGCIM